MPSGDEKLKWRYDTQNDLYGVLPSLAIASLIRNRALIFSLARREVIGRYQGSALGVLWSFFTPAIMLAVYTFFFGIVFQSRWPRMGDSTAEFALILFSGLLIFNLFSECTSRAPALIVSNTNFVKRVIFPLDIFAWINLASGLFHAFISLLVWITFYVLFIGVPHVTALLALIVILPLCISILGLSWLLSSLGVYLRDVSQVVGPIIGALMFLTPIFYPLDTLPATMRAVIALSPLTYAVEAARASMMWGESIVWTSWLLHLAGASLFSALSFAWFQKTRKGFADVL